MRVEMYDVDPVLFLRDYYHLDDRARAVHGFLEAVREVRFGRPVLLQVVGDDDRAQLFYRAPGIEGRLYHVGPAPADFAGGVGAYLARRWPGVTFWAPGDRGEPVCLVDCRGPGPAPPGEDLDGLLRDLPDFDGPGEDVSAYTSPDPGLPTAAVPRYEPGVQVEVSLEGRRELPGKDDRPF